MSSSRKSQLLLALGAVVGISVAAVDLCRAPVKSSLPDGAVAIVNGHPIRRDDYANALAAVAADRRDGAESQGIRRHVLDRLIDEELLVQAALDLGLAQRDRRVRADLATAAIGFLTETPSAAATETELRELYREHAGFFAEDQQLELVSRFFRARGLDDASARVRAREARAAWTRAGEPPEAGDPPSLPLPRGALPLAKLEQYLGPTARRAVADLPVGEVSQPVETGDGLWLFAVVARKGGQPRPFSEVRSAVLAEWQRRKSEARLREFLESRRAEASVVVAAELGS
jgi:hypothetical protein